MNLYTSLTLRYLRENKKRTIVTIIGIILSTALICGIGNIASSLMDFQIRQTIKNKGSFYATLYDVNKDSIDYIAKSAQVDSYGMSRTLGSSLINKETNSIMQIKEYDKNMLDGFDIKLKEGKFPDSDNEIVMSEESLSAMGKKYKVGDRITLSVGDRVNSEGTKINSRYLEENETIKNEKEKIFKIVGIIEKPGFQAGNIITYAFVNLNKNNIGDKQLTNVSIKIKNPKEIYEVVPEICKNVGIEPKIVEGTENDPKPYYENLEYNEHLLRLLGASEYENINGSMSSIILLIVSLVIICTIATVYNAFSISIGERKKQFGILNSMGATSNQVMKLVFLEGFIVSIVALPIGLASGTFAIDVVFKVINIMFDKSLIAEMDLRVVYNPSVIIFSSIIILITIFIAAILPAITAAKTSPLDAIRNTSEFKIGKVKNSKLVKIIFKTEGILAYKNLRRNKKKFRVTLFSLIISVVIFVSFSGFMKLMIRSEEVRLGRSTFDLKVSINGSDRDKGLSNNFLEEVKNLKGINNLSVMREWSELDVTLKINENKINKDYQSEVEGSLKKSETSNESVYETLNNEILAPGDIAINNIKLNSGSFNKKDAIKEDGVILVNRSLYEGSGKKGEINFTNYKVGDTIEGYITLGYDENDNEIKKEFKCKIMATTDDLIPGVNGYELMGLDLITYDEVAKNLGNEVLKESVFIDSNKDEITRSTVKELSEKYSYYFEDQTEESKIARDTYMAMQVFVYGFIVVISLVSVTNIVNTISTNINLRKRELAIIQSIGVTPGGFNKMIYLESLLYGALSLIYGLPISIGIVLLMNKFLSDVIEFGIVLPWDAVGICVVGIFVITFISSYIPMKKISKENIIDNIRQESI